MRRRISSLAAILRKLARRSSGAWANFVWPPTLASDVSEAEIDTDTLDETTLEIPSDLSGPLPRTVRFSDGSIALPIIVALAMVVGCVWYYISTVQSFHERTALYQNGVEIRGLVTSIGHGKGSTVVHYTFDVKETTFFGRADIPGGMWRQIEKSKDIPVRYLASDPNVNHPAAWDWEWDAFAFVPILFMIGIGIAMGAIIISVLRERTILIAGTPAPGIITNCWSGGRGSINLDYDFRTQTGTSMSGRCNTGERQEIGAPIWVVYLPDDPQRNTIYPSSTFYVG